jgi:hypothetical protein
MEFYSALKNNDNMWFEGKWMQLEDIMLSEVKKGSKRQRAHVFPYMWKIDTKDKDIHENKCNLIQTHM